MQNSKKCSFIKNACQPFRKLIKFIKKLIAVNLGSAPTTYIGSRVGSDFSKTSILKVGSG